MKTLESVEKARLAAAEARQKILEPKRNISPGPWQWRYHTAGLSLLNAKGTEILRASFVEEEEAPALQAVPELVAALRAVIAALTQPVQTTPHSGEDSVSSLLGCIDVLRGDARFAVNEARAALSKAGQA